jgi:pimeloyl-ACP methyl ester carboxylesterase
VSVTGEGSQQADMKPTIVLVHGAFADASSWNGVIERLQQQEGYTVIAPPNPLRGVAADSAYLASLLNQIDGPVLLTGHSYGGAVITNAATSASNVVGLVYVAAFAPDEGENLGDVEKRVEGQRPERGLGPVHLPDRTRRGDIGRVRDQPCANPGGFRR